MIHEGVDGTELETELLVGSIGGSGKVLIVVTRTNVTSMVLGKDDTKAGEGIHVGTSFFL